LGRFCHVVYPLGFALRATTQHVGKAGGLQILCCQGFDVNDYNFTLDALALKPSGFCNVRVSLQENPEGRKRLLVKPARGQLSETAEK